MVRKGRAHTHPAHGIGASSITHNQRRPLALTKWPWLDRTGSRSIPRALILAPQRRSIVSSRPITTGGAWGGWLRWVGGRQGAGMTLTAKSPYAGYRFPGEVISHALNRHERRHRASES